DPSKGPQARREKEGPLSYGDAGRRLDLPGELLVGGLSPCRLGSFSPKVARLRRVRRRAVEMPAPPSGQLSWRGGGVECDRGLSDGRVESDVGSAAEGGDGAVGIAGVDDVDAVLVETVLDAGTKCQKGV